MLRVIIFSLLGFSLVACSHAKKDLSFVDSKYVPVIELSGTGYERGLKHGQLLKNEIAEVYLKWKKSLRNSTKQDVDSLIDAFINATDFEPAIKKWTPEILEEVRGIADGSGQKFKDVYAFQLVDEFWVYLDYLTNSGTDHCSCIGVTSSKNHPAYVAQNMDLESYMNGYQILLHIHGSKKLPEQFILTCAGLIVTTGMNEYGIGVNPNTLMELQSSTDGLPVAYVIRGILSQEKSEEVVPFIYSVKHASGQNYVIGIRDSVYDFEASANQIVRFYTKTEQTGIVYHTNHALINHDVKAWYLNYHKAVLAGETRDWNSEVRFSTLQKRLGRPVNEVSSEEIKSALRSKDDEKNPICHSYKEGDNVFTFSSVIYTLTGKCSVQVTKGSPDQSEYQEHFFTN